MKKHNCKIVFCDINVGEFQHEIMGDVTMPDISSNEIRTAKEVFVDVPKVIEPAIWIKNDLLTNAKQTY